MFCPVTISVVHLQMLQVLNMLCCWVENPNSEAFKLHIARIDDYLWIAEDGMKMQVKIHYCHSLTCC